MKLSDLDEVQMKLDTLDEVEMKLDGIQRDDQNPYLDIWFSEMVLIRNQVFLVNTTWFFWSRIGVSKATSKER